MQKVRATLVEHWSSREVGQKQLGELLSCTTNSLGTAISNPVDANHVNHSNIRLRGNFPSQLETQATIIKVTELRCSVRSRVTANKGNHVIKLCFMS